MEISIKESTMVHPAEEHTPKGSIWNSNLDRLISRYHVSTVYFYKPNGCSDFFDTGRVKEGLSKVLVPFYPIAGRLGYDENGRLEIMCNDEGVLFVEAETSSVLEDLVGNGDFTHNSHLVPKVDYSGGISSYPLLVVQITKFKCGGVCLGVGTSAIHFINSWADTARGVSPAIAPFIDRTLLRARVRPVPKFHHIEYEPSPPLKAVESDLKPSTVSTFKLTVDQLNALKAKAAANSSGTKYSSYNILAAHIWRCVSKAMGLSDDQPTKMYFPVDARSKLNPPLPPGYFGNVIFINALITQAGDLNTESFLDTIKRIHEGLKQINDEYLRSALDYIETVSDSSTLVRGSHTFRCPNLIVNTWMRLPIYEADFGWGRPIHTGPADIVHEGIVYLLPTPINDGSLLLVARLEISHMSCFEKLLYEF
ncbi:shikimate O-hydroxycinnamoyltransferase isoform X2 [Gossypium raimondii]|uniref:Shikimate O-hydroxycinnamoyltransferase n=1 Tax=Gossypium raimondii TaxID=29730 RepID=A0A0D2SXU7_GOSRA|nr:shikimate O-hydroxycinnamoyltransferase isoform X2 [Gossypium raimondii]KJB68227.1 hypothetical protein B456_010G233600 [Gossypium raimondii]KJB68228.1 hypothetical protein B456_010G233600 [Gossypium raimondii]